MSWTVHVQDERGDVIQELGSIAALSRRWTPEDLDRLQLPAVASRAARADELACRGR